MNGKSFEDDDIHPLQTVEHAQEDGGTERLPWGIPGSFPALPCRAGPMRGKHSVLGVASDGEAVAAWIADKASGSKHTAVSYRRESERLMLWAAVSRGKSLSELTREDFVAFQRFLLDPQPADQWIMTRRHTRGSVYWRPFMARLSPRSQMQSLRILYGLMRYLVDTGWLRANPMPAPKRQVGSDFTPRRRALIPTHWDAVVETMRNAPRDNWIQLVTAERRQWLLGMIYDLGLRASEVCSLAMSDFRCVDGSNRWSVRVIRKGRKESYVPVSHRTIERLKRFRRVLGLPPYPTLNETFPVAPRIAVLCPVHHTKTTLEDAITPNQLYRVCVETFRETADQIECRDPDAAQFLRQASTHWLRHTALTNLADHTGDLRLVQLLADHSDINTSARYTRQDEEVLRKAMDSLGQ